MNDNELYTVEDGQIVEKREQGLRDDLAAALVVVEAAREVVRRFGPIERNFYTLSDGTDKKNKVVLEYWSPAGNMVHTEHIAPLFDAVREYEAQAKEKNV